MGKNNRSAGLNCAWGAALIPRTIALFIILFQIRLFAGELADTPVFAAALLGGLGCAIYLFFKNIRPIPALVIMALAPWAARFVIAVPRWIVPESAYIVFDSLLLNLDRNNFVSLLPFYWTTLSSYFSLKNRSFLRVDIITADLLFLILFSMVSTTSMEVYRWPVLMIALFAIVFFLQILSFILSVPAELRVRSAEKLAAAGAVAVLVILGSLLFIRPSQERAVGQGGGLLEPRLFRFDFSQFLRLESEISMNNDLVLIVKKDIIDHNILLRRYTLSGYSPRQGFFRLENIDERAHPQRLPPGRTQLPLNEQLQTYRETFQEYYLVNFDPSAFVGMNTPIEIIPYESWDRSSFSSAYGVLSYTSDAFAFELYNAVEGLPSAENLGLTAEDYRLYTDYGNDLEYAELAMQITSNFNSYWEKVESVYHFLKYGEYRYSLRPGIAPDGDQLKFFLFESKKGYCSYFAFAYALLLRSLGIPSRVAAGFFIDNDTHVFNYFPVRANMAHAWVEIWYPGYGWIEYDPTSQELAYGEEFIFSQDTPENFESLLREILENHSSLRVREGRDEASENILSNLGRETILFLQNQGLWLLLFSYLLFCVSFRGGLLWLSIISKNKRLKARFLWAHSQRRLRLGGFKGQRDLGEAEWAQQCPIKYFYALYQNNAAARFAPNYSAEDFLKMKENYHAFNKVFNEAVSPLWRFFSWILPPLIKIKYKTLILIFFILIFSQGVNPNWSDAQDTIIPADELFREARRAQDAENWEQAVELFSLGSQLYPQDINFPWALGNIYYQRRLFRLAWDEYLRSERISPMNPDILFQLARTAGFLNMDELSADYWQRLLILNPDNREAIGNLGWMYFKIHRLLEGEALLLSAISRFGYEPDFTMTLGTIYSALYNYEEAKKWYLEAINAAEFMGDRLFAAVAHYNLSILESRFYYYDLAYERTNMSLHAVNRSSGRLAMGELLLRRMDLSSALREYQEAFDMDTSPLSKLNLAQIFQIGGRLEEARLYAEDCLNAADHSWMLNYGIDPVRYFRDIHEILANTYKGLGNAEVFKAPENIGERFLRPFRIINYRFKAEVHRQLFQKYCLLSAQAYGQGDIDLEALIQYYNAFESYPRRALSYLNRARAYEEERIPGSIPSYFLEEGKLLKKQNLLYRALESLDPLWERDLIAETYVELARHFSEELFAINRGALRQNGIRLEVDLQIQGASPGTRRILEKAARTAGFKPVGNGFFNRNTGSGRYTLILSIEQGNEQRINCELWDRSRRINQQIINLPSLSAKDQAAFSLALGNTIFDGFSGQ